MTPGRSILVTPGYAEAVANERLVRDAAFLCRVETVAGFDLRPMTLRHYLVLRLAGSPCLAKTGDVEPWQAAAFLWLLSPEWTPGARARARFMRRCRPFAQPGLPLFSTQRAIARWGRQSKAAKARLAEVVKGIREFVEETMLDRPSGGKGGYGPSYYSDVCFWWGTLGRNGYPMSREEILETPLKILFQSLREITESKGGHVVNKSDGLKAEHLQRLNAELRAN